MKASRGKQAAQRPTKGSAITASYDAVTQKTRRRTNVTNLKREDDVLVARDRDKLVSEGRVLRRNAPDVGWMIRKHLDYVSTFDFQCRTGIPELDQKIEDLIRWWARPFNCDVAGRHSLHKLIRLVEGMATTDGDCFVMKLSDGRVQVIEGDRVRNPNDLGEFSRDTDLSKFVHGIEVSEGGKAQRYAICDRTGIGNGFVLRSIIPAQHVYQHGYFERVDQVRGVSPLASAINTFCDLYEAREYALAKMKLSQIFALKMSLAGDDEGDEGEPYTFDFGKGPQVIRMSPGDNAEFLETATPSNEFQSFLQTGIQIGLKALDIPFSFFSEDFTNYSGARQALIQYDQSCEEKRERVRQLLQNLTIWRLGLFIADGELELPDGLGITDLNFEWISAAIPWIDPQKEATAFGMMIDLKLKSRQEICKEQGKDWYQVVDQIAAEEDYMKAKGLDPTTSGHTPQVVVQQPDDQGDQNDQRGKTAA